VANACAEELAVCGVEGQSQQRPIVVYLEALALSPAPSPLPEAQAYALQRAIRRKRYRALNPGSEQGRSSLGKAISRGEILPLTGLTPIDDIDKNVLPGKAQARQRRRQSAAITRKLAWLRAHGLSEKSPAIHRYTIKKKKKKPNMVVALSPHFWPPGALMSISLPAWQP